MAAYNECGKFRFDLVHFIHIISPIILHQPVLNCPTSQSVNLILACERPLVYKKVIYIVYMLSTGPFLNCLCLSLRLPMFPSAVPEPTTMIIF